MAAPEAGRYKANVAGRRGEFPLRGSHPNNRNRRPLQGARYEPRFRCDVEAAWRLGPHAVACLLEEIAGGADLQATVAQYAELDGDFMRRMGGDRFPPAVHAIDGGAL